jgi:hydroxypyruvate isomerase
MELIMNLSRRDFVKSGSAAVLAAGTIGAAAEAGEKPVKKPGRTEHTKFAVNLEIWWAKKDMLERIRRTAELGYPAVEFWGCEGKDLDAMKKACNGFGLEIAQFTAWGFEPGMNDPANHAAFEAKIREACAVAKRLNCRKATVVGGNDQPGMTREEMHANIITALKRVAPLCEDAGLMLILEPMNIRVDHKGHCLYGSPDAVRICREVNSPMVKINWDLYHMQISEGDLCGRLKDGFDQLGYVQVADNPGRHEPGTGEINFGRVMKQVRDLGYRDFVGLECWPIEDPEKAAQRIAKMDVWE